MKYLIVFSLLIVSNFASAKTLWSDYSVSLLKGSNYEVGDNDKTVLTFEHTAATSWGDSFLFVDRLESDNNDRETYGEWSPRIKLTSFKDSFVKSVYIASTLEMGSFASATGFGSGFNNYLLGVGVDVNIPGFKFFKINLYHRNNEYGGNSYQTTLVWGVPLGPLYYDGFLDFATSRDNSENSMNLTSQLKYNLAPHLDLSSKLFVGVEYVFWKNKFGIDGVDENNVNLLVKYHF